MTLCKTVQITSIFKSFEPVGSTLHCSFNLFLSAPLLLTKVFSFQLKSLEVFPKLLEFDGAMCNLKKALMSASSVAVGRTAVLLMFVCCSRSHDELVSAKTLLKHGTVDSVHLDVVSGSSECDAIIL